MPQLLIDILEDRLGAIAADITRLETDYKNSMTATVSEQRRYYASAEKLRRHARDIEAAIKQAATQ